MNSRSELVRHSIAFLKSLQASGLNHVDRSEKIEGFLKTPTPSPIKQPPVSPVATETPLNKPAKKKNAHPPADSKKLEELRLEVCQCEICELHKNRTATVLGRGGLQVRVMFVGSWLLHKPETLPLKETVFGREEDLMLFRMIEAISLRKEEIFATNVVKCLLPEETQPLAGHVDCCKPYLLRQINLLQPEVICTMGPIPTRFFLNDNKALSQLRGKSYPFEIAGGEQALVIPTYHPTFLLANPGMRRATWADLQKIQKILEQ